MSKEVKLECLGCLPCLEASNKERNQRDSKRRTCREHRCDDSQIPSEGQVRTSHNSRVLERGKLCVPWLVRVSGLL